MQNENKRKWRHQHIPNSIKIYTNQITCHYIGNFQKLVRQELEKKKADGATNISWESSTKETVTVTLKCSTELFHHLLCFVFVTNEGEVQKGNDPISSHKTEPHILKVWTWDLRVENAKTELLGFELIFISFRTEVIV